MPLCMSSNIVTVCIAYWNKSGPYISGHCSKYVYLTKSQVSDTRQSIPDTHVYIYSDAACTRFAIDAKEEAQHSTKKQAHTCGNNSEPRPEAETRAYVEYARHTSEAIKRFQKPRRGGWGGKQKLPGIGGTILILIATRTPSHRQKPIYSSTLTKQIWSWLLDRVPPVTPLGPEI